MLRRTQLGLLTEPGMFWWATGIEDTFITTPWPATGRLLDEYELIGHYDRWEEDIELMASLGVKVVRYGIPWYRVNPSPDSWDWTWADYPLERLLELGIDPVIDLVHFGVPQWMDGAFLHADFPERMADYAARLAERFRGRIHAYTPLNEPRITAWYCGRLGWWPPFLKGWRGFVQVMLQVCRGIVLTCHRLLSVDPENIMVHVDAAELYSSPDRTLAAEVEWRQQLTFLALDLIGGCITDEHPFWQWLMRNGAREADLQWFNERSVPLDIIGFNVYPMFSNKRLIRSPRGLRGQMPYASAALVERLAELYWERYGHPLLITETAARSTISRRRAWLEDSVIAIRHLRKRGIPLVGYTWWPMIGLIRWAYRQSNRPITAYIEKMGLWDLDPSHDGTLRRLHTPLVDAYRELVAGGHDAVGLLNFVARDHRRDLASV